MFALTSTELDPFALGDALQARGWYLDRQKPPDSLHATVSAGNAPVVDEFLTDLRADHQPGWPEISDDEAVAQAHQACDQLIDICMIRKVQITRAVDFARRMFTGYINRSRFVDIIHGKQIHLKFTKPMPFHIDGESMGPQNEFNIKVEPGSLKMIVPPNPRLKF